MNPLAQTSSTDATTPQGNLVGNGVAMERTHFSKSFTEHGFIHIFVSFRGDLSYSQGLDRFWTRDTKWDYYWPDLANIGEQATLKGELLITGFPALDEAVFGYLPRYEEYRSKKNWLSANMRPGVTDTTDYWHLSQELGDAVLGSGFIRSNTPFDRVMQVPTQPTFLCDFYFDYKHTRPMGTYSIPGGLTRF